MNWDWEKLKAQQSKSDGPQTLSDVINKFKGTKLPFGTPLLIIIIFLVLFFGSSVFYTVNVDEVGVVQLFGKFTRITSSGLNFKLPAGIEKVTKIKVKRIYKEEFGSRSARDIGSDYRSRYSSSNENLNVSLMLTGDLNVALVPWIVQYKVKDPYNYLFKVKNIKRLLIDMSETTMRSVIGDRGINEVITKRQEIATEAARLLQLELDKAEAGINIITIEMKKTNVPAPVQSSFNEVNQAVQEKEKLIYQAKEDYNKAVPAARGRADRTIKDAEGYALDRINRAKGDASRFILVYNEYVKAKDITKRRLYLETIKELFPKLGHKYIVDANLQSILPLLNLSTQEGAKK